MKRDPSTEGDAIGRAPFEGGEMAAHMCAFDGSKTPLGPVEHWPLALRSPLGICLGSSFPSAICWGPQLALLYNDAWSPILGDKHPWALGRPAREVWPEFRDSIGPMFAQALETGQATRLHDQLLPMHRRGFTEECWFDCTWSPIRGEDGKVEGIFNSAVETTVRHIGERRTRLLRELNEQTARAQSAAEVCARAAAALAADPHDLPYCLLYLVEGKQARLAGAAGLAAGTAASPQTPVLDAPAWPLAPALESKAGVVLEGLAQRFGFALPGGPWPEPCERALLLPIASSAALPPAGVLVAGISPRLALDSEYRAFIERAAASIGAALAGARTMEQERTGVGEQSFRDLAEAMPQIVYVCGADGRIEYVSRQWQDYTGHANADAEELPAVVHADDLPRLLDRWQHAAREGTPLTAEFRLRRTDGEYRWFLTRATPVHGADGKVARWFGTSTNIDFQKRQAEVLKRAHDALQQADRRKDEFLATLAHELRNPLAPLRNSVHLLQMSTSPETAGKVHAMMQRQIDHLVRLVDDLLEVSRITSGKIELQRAPVLLSAVLISALEASRPLIETGGHRLDLDVDADGLRIDGDAVRLVQVFSNLLNNAAKYTESGGRIVLSARRDGDDALVSVQDDGVGIAPELLPRVFELFVQAEAAGSRSQGGLGIGLSLVQSLLALHGGNVEAKSEGLGRGSQFIVRLPLWVAPGEGAAASLPDAASPKPALAPLLRVLVCDDNRDAADSLASLLEFLGTSARVVYDGAAALRAAQAERPQLVLLDIGMPEMDGYAVARALRALPQGRELVLVALTGWGQQRDRERTRVAGFDRHLVKPVELAALQALLASVADERAGSERREQTLEGTP